MATIHRLNSDWTLTDGIIPPIRLDRPMPIYDALRAANLVPDARYQLNLTAAEWLYSRNFVYEKKFDLPPSADTERTELHFEKMFGECAVSVNGNAVSPFASGKYDVTAFVRPADNLLRVSIAPEMLLRPFGGDPLPSRGISGSVSLTGVNRITLHRAAFSADGELTCNLVIDAHISGKYHFTCVLSREGEAIATYEAHQRLIAAQQPVTLKFPLPEDADGMYDVLLTIEHNGLLCDQLRGTVATLRKPEVVCHIDGDPRANGENAILALLPLLKQAGFDGVSFQHDALYTRRISTRMQELALSRAEYDASAPAFVGCMDADTIRKYAQGVPCHTSDTAAWRLRHSDIPEIKAASPDKFDRWTAAVRLHQAQQVFDAIADMRKAGKPLSLRCCADAFPRFGSTALADDDAARPALYAAAQALQPLIAVADIPHDVQPCGEVLKLPILLLSRNTPPIPVTVTATMHAIDGGVISGTSFSALPGGEMRLGELNCELPRDARCALLRTIVEQSGQPPIIADRWIACGDMPIQPDDLPAAAPEISGETCTSGATPVYGAVTKSGIRMLLPGESAEGFSGEYLNV